MGTQRNGLITIDAESFCKVSCFKDASDIFACDQVPCSSIISFSNNGSLQQYGVCRDKPTQTWWGHQGLTCLARNGDYLVGGMQDGSVCVWQLSSGCIVRLFKQEHLLPVRKVAVQAISNGKSVLVLSAAGSRSILRDLHMGKTFTWDCKAAILDLHFGLLRVWALDAVGTVSCWSCRDGAVLARLHCFPESRKNWKQSTPSTPAENMSLYFAVNSLETKIVVGDAEGKGLHVFDLSGQSAVADVCPLILEKYRIDLAGWSVLRGEECLYAVSGTTIMAFDFGQHCIASVELGLGDGIDMIVSRLVPITYSPKAKFVDRIGMLQKASKHEQPLISTRINGITVPSAKLFNNDSNAQGEILKEEHEALLFRYEQLQERFVQVSQLNEQLCKALEGRQHS